MTENWTRSDLAGNNAGLAGPIRTWKPPARRDWTPKSDSPGQRITWTRHQPGHWTELPDTWGGRMPDTSKYVQPRDTERTGTIWSAGPPGIRAVWVQPDDEPDGMVLVSAGGLEQSGYDRDWQRLIVRVCDNLNASAGLVREYETVRRYGWNSNVHDEHVIAWHADPDCPAIGHHAGGGYPPAIGDVIRDLLSRKQRTDLCQACVWLNAPAEVAA